MQRHIFNFLKLKNEIFFTLVLIFILASAASCQILDSEENGETEPVEEETEEISEEEFEEVDKSEVKITLWDCLEPKGRLALMESIENFMADYSYINIEIEHFRSQEELEDKFEAASLAGAGPEIILLNFDGVERLAPENVVKEVVSETIEAADYSLFLDGLVEISEHNGKKYIIPFRSFDFLVFLYNKELVENPPESFEEILTYCSEVNNFREKVYGFLLNSREADWIIPFIGGYGDWIVDYSYNSLTLENDATVKTLEFLNYIYNEEKILPHDIEYGEINELFKSGNSHMIIDKIEMLKEYQEAGINVGVMEIPRVWQDNRKPTPLISGLGFMINVNCYGSELEASGEFISYLLSEKIQTEWTLATDTYPVLKNITGNETIRENDIVYNAFKQAKLCRGKPYDRLIMVIRNALRDNGERVISGDMLPADAALKIQEDALRLRSGNIPAEENGQVEESGETGQIQETE